MAKTMRQLRTEAQPGPVKTTEVEVVRSVQTILASARRKAERSTLVASLKKQELTAIFAEAHASNTAEKAAKKQYDDLKSIIVEHAKLKNWTEKELGDFIAKFEPRTDRSLDPWALFQVIKEKDLTKEEKKNLFNAVFSVSFTGADKSLGKDVVNKLCKENGTMNDNVYGALKVRPVA